MHDLAVHALEPLSPHGTSIVRGSRSFGRCIPSFLDADLATLHVDEILRISRYHRHLQNLLLPVVRPFREASRVRFGAVGKVWQIPTDKDMAEIATVKPSNSHRSQMDQK